MKRQLLALAMVLLLCSCTILMPVASVLPSPFGGPIKPEGWSCPGTMLTGIADATIGSLALLGGLAQSSNTALGWGVAFAVSGAIGIAFCASQHGDPSPAEDDSTKGAGSGQAGDTPTKACANKDAYEKALVDERKKSVVGETTLEAVGAAKTKLSLCLQGVPSPVTPAPDAGVTR